MNSDQVKGKIEHAVGHVKEAFGEAVGNNKVANEGLADQAKGATRETWGNVKDASAVKANEHETVATDHAANIRQSVSQSIDNAKNAINDHIDAYKETHKR
jgi:uncharacterized protein YjbJ (UPF0337 family)